jgi:hypothetical protein
MWSRDHQAGLAGGEQEQYRCALARAATYGDQEELGCLRLPCLCDAEQERFNEDDEAIAEALSRLRHPAGKGLEWRKSRKLRSID